MLELTPVSLPAVFREAVPLDINRQFDFLIIRKPILEGAFKTLMKVSNVTVIKEKRRWLIRISFNSNP